MTEENVLLVITALTGIVGMPLIGWIKSKFKIDGNVALGLAVAVSFALGLVIAFVNGQITGALVDPKQVADAFGVVFTTATVLFKLMNEGKTK